MDEFSWFVGLYEGEGCYYKDSRPSIKSPRGIMEISMTDEDTISRAAKFLNVNYRPIKVAENRKPQWRIRCEGGLTRGKTFAMMKRLYPYLSKRRQEQLDNVWGKPNS
tara:strand:+ start:1276 stop:1599 length:324 start_codon:yes stop_codon:yes gene_type:complete